VLHALLCLAPALALGLLLLAKRYPGERALLAMRRGDRRRLPRAARVLTFGARETVRVVRGGLLIGSSLAVRPPPLARAAS
jgi:hypothetical protein